MMASESAGTYDWPNPAVGAPRPEGAEYPAIPETERERVARLERELAASRATVQALQQANAILRNCLEHYADESFYEPTRSGDVEPVWVVRGEMAQEALRTAKVSVDGMAGVG